MTSSGVAPKNNRSMPSGRSTNESLISIVVVVVSSIVVVVVSSSAVVVVVSAIVVVVVVGLGGGVVGGAEVTTVVGSADSGSSPEVKARTTPSVTPVAITAADRAIRVPRWLGVRRDGRVVMASQLSLRSAIEADGAGQVPAVSPEQHSS